MSKKGIIGGFLAAALAVSAAVPVFGQDRDSKAAPPEKPVPADTKKDNPKPAPADSTAGAMFNIASTTPPKAKTAEEIEKEIAAIDIKIVDARGRPLAEEDIKKFGMLGSQELVWKPGESGKRVFDHAEPSIGFVCYLNGKANKSDPQGVFERSAPDFDAQDDLVIAEVKRAAQQLRHAGMPFGKILILDTIVAPDAPQDDPGKKVEKDKVAVFVNGVERVSFPKVTAGHGGVTDVLFLRSKEKWEKEVARLAAESGVFQNSANVLENTR